MRVLLMISNSNMAARELYGLALRGRFPGWGVSHMSGLPTGAASIVKSFDVVVFELGAADDPRRYRQALALWDEVKELGTVRLITRIEGPLREGMVADLEGRGVICVGTPFTPESATAAFERAAPQPRGKAPDASRERSGLGERLRGLWRRN